MVDAITTGGTAGAGAVLPRAVSLAGTTPVAPVLTPAPTPSAAPAQQLAALAKAVSASAPVDTDRVAQIKAAIANGTFPILPATIADQMLSFRYEWMSNDEA